MKVWGMLGVLAALLLAGAMTVAGSAAGEDGADSATVREAFCDSQGPCRVINNLEFSEAPESADSLPPFREALETYGRPAEECPAATAAYEADGQPVDAFLGPCPGPTELPGASG